MKKEYVLIENEKYKLLISLDESNFDYYTDVYIELIYDEKSILLFKDNLLALKNIIGQYNEIIDMLDVTLDESKLGILLNDYYRWLNENEFQDGLILDNQGQWIGEKYCCLLSSEYVTWLYRYDGNIVIKVTPVFPAFEEDDYSQEYYEFTQKYSDIFRTTISQQQLIYVKEVVFELYNKLLK